MQAVELASIRDAIEENIGRRVWLKAHRGRRKSVEREGTLTRTFPSVFTVELDTEETPQTMSYTYSDIFTNNLEVKLID